MTETIRVLVVDDHAVVRRGILALLATEPGIEVVGEAGNGRDAVEMAASLKPDVVIMDLIMRGMGGVEAIRQIRSRGIESHVLVLTSFGSEDKLFPAIKAGAMGYLLKDTSPGALVLGIRQAARGDSVLTPTVARRLLREFYRHKDLEPPIEPLSGREVDVLREIAHGLGNDAIAAELSISATTVRTHISHIFEKLGIENRTQAAIYALRVGMASVDDLDGEAL